MRGRTISIFIPDNNPRGVKICDIKDSIVKAIFVPRNKLDKVYHRSDLTEPGIYFLIGKEDTTDKPKVYIGEAENLLIRIKQHNAKKDFWNTVICFVSEKRNINKAHIKYLENYCCNKAKTNKKCTVENSTKPNKPSLTEQDIDFVLSFFDDLKILIATLGFPIFEENKKENENTFICKGKNAFGKGEYLENGMVVFKGSRLNSNETKTIGGWAKNLRQLLIDKKIIKLEKNGYFFNEDYVFNSPSAASSVILGRSSNGWTDWKDKNNKTLDDKYRKNDK